MDKYHFYGHFTFEADGIDNALSKLENHFRCVRRGIDKSIICSGEIHLNKLDESYHSKLISRGEAIKMAEDIIKNAEEKRKNSNED